MWDNITGTQLVIIVLVILGAYLVGALVASVCDGAEIDRLTDQRDAAELVAADLHMEVGRLSALLLDSAVLECIEGSVDCSTPEDDNVVPLFELEPEPFGPAIKWDRAIESPAFQRHTNHAMIIASGHGSSLEEVNEQLADAGLPPLPDQGPIFGDDCR